MNENTCKAIAAAIIAIIAAIAPQNIKLRFEFESTRPPPVQQSPSR